MPNVIWVYGNERIKKKEEDESKSETISGKSSGYLGRTRRIQERTMKSVNAVRSINGIVFEWRLRLGLIKISSEFLIFRFN